MSNKSLLGSESHFANLGGWKAGSPTSNPLLLKALSTQIGLQQPHTTIATNLGHIPVEITQEDLCHQFVVTTRVLTTCALTERPASLPPQSLTQRYHRSRVSIKKGLLQKGHDHMLWSKITTHYLQSCTVWVDLAIAFCRHNCLNKS